MKLPISAVRLPLVNRLYRAAFRSGHGGEGSGFTQALARPLFYLLESLRLPRDAKLEVDLTVRGVAKTLRLNAYNRQFNPLYFAKYAEGYEVTVARSLAALLPDDGVMLDIGANWGYFPLLMASRESFSGKILAFEPVPTTHADLVDVIEQAGLREWIEPMACAIGEANSTLAMRVPRHSGLARFDEKGDTRVEVKSLDSLNLSRIDVIKIDVEGHELGVFKGAVETLRRLGPALIFESGVGERAKAQPPLEYLESVGYRLHRPEVDGERIEFHPFKAAERPEMKKYFNVVAWPEGRGAEDPVIISRGLPN